MRGGTAQTIAAAVNRIHLCLHIYWKLEKGAASTTSCFHELQCFIKQSTTVMNTGAFLSEMVPDTPTNSAILCTKLQQVSEVNSQVPTAVRESPRHTGYSTDYVRDEGRSSVDLNTTEFLNSFNLSGISFQSLTTLKKGCLVILSEI